MEESEQRKGHNMGSVEVPAADMIPFHVDEDLDSLLTLMHDNAGELATQLPELLPRASSEHSGSSAL